MINMLGIFIFIMFVLFLLILLGLYIYIRVYDWAALPSNSPYVFFHTNGKWLVLVHNSGGYPVFGYDLVNNQFFFTYRITYELKYAFTYIYRWFGFWTISKFFVTNHDFNHVIINRSYNWSVVYYHINLQYADLKNGWILFITRLTIPVIFYSYLFSMLLLFMAYILSLNITFNLFYFSIFRLVIFVFLLLILVVGYIFFLYNINGFNPLVLTYHLLLLVINIMNFFPEILLRVICLYFNIWICLNFNLFDITVVFSTLISFYLILYFLWVICVLLLNRFNVYLPLWLSTPVSMMFLPIAIIILYFIFTFVWWIRSFIYSIFIFSFSFFISLLSNTLFGLIDSIYYNYWNTFNHNLDSFSTLNYYLHGLIASVDVFTVPPYGNYLLSIYLNNERLVMFEVPLSYLNIAFSNMQRGYLMSNDLVGYDPFKFNDALFMQMLNSNSANS